MVTTIFSLHSATVTTNACTQRAKLQHAELFIALQRKKRRRRCNDSVAVSGIVVVTQPKIEPALLRQRIG